MNSMKKTSVLFKNNAVRFLFTVVISFCVSSYASAQKASVYIRAGSTGIVRQQPGEDDIKFGGAYLLFNGTVTDPHYVVCAQTRFKLTESSSWSELGTKSVWEKAYVGFDIPVYQQLRLYGGKSMPLYLTGAFMPQLEDYISGARWEKDGIAFTVTKDMFLFGAGLTSSTTQILFKDGIQCAAAIQTNWSKKNIPLAAGITLDYNSAGDGDANSNGVKDWTSALVLQYEFVPGLTMSAGYTFNGDAVTADSSYQYVANYKTAQLQHMHTASLISSLKTDTIQLEEETEYGISFDDSYTSLYGALRIQFPLAGIVSAKPAVQYFAVWNGNDSSASRDSLVLYPRLVLSKGKHYVSLGAQIEYREIADDTRKWGWDLPFYYKYTL